MIITKDKTIKEIKEVFNNSFPGLKIEFYKKHHGAYEGSMKDAQYDEHLTFEKISSSISSCEIDLSKTQSTKEVEDAFEERCALHVQIFRMSKDLWLQTSTTDDWTLEHQNEKGLQSRSN